MSNTNKKEQDNSAFASRCRRRRAHIASRPQPNIAISPPKNSPLPAFASLLAPPYLPPPSPPHSARLPPCLASIRDPPSHIYPPPSTAHNSPPPNLNAHYLVLLRPEARSVEKRTLGCYSLSYIPRRSAPHHILRRCTCNEPSNIMQSPSVTVGSTTDRIPVEQVASPRVVGAAVPVVVAARRRTGWRGVRYAVCSDEHLRKSTLF